LGANAKGEEKSKKTSGSKEKFGYRGEKEMAGGVENLHDGMSGVLKG